MQMYDIRCTECNQGFQAPVGSSVILKPEEGWRAVGARGSARIEHRCPGQNEWHPARMKYADQVAAPATPQVIPPPPPQFETRTKPKKRFGTLDDLKTFLLKQIEQWPEFNLKETNPGFGTAEGVDQQVSKSTKPVASVFFIALPEKRTQGEAPSIDIQTCYVEKDSGRMVDRPAA